ncbi:GNAT family N-acetyltransferase [Actinosynnema sp. NPDC020468]|uniref:GNAT family N-acetyltransferase n=1 Tax=Actinosynnema sp. NPDC020468 TaxID=3154488 RepID=UPI00340B93D2
MSSPLDNPAYESLLGHHSRFAERQGRVLRYQEDVAPFLALPAEPYDGVWDDVAALAGPGAVVGVNNDPPEGWELVERAGGVQLVDAGVRAEPFAEAVRLTDDDVPEMLDLVERTKPGPFRPRTIELGTYLGVRRDGVLVAMAGERMHPPGWTEISAVCTLPEFRGQGLATRLVLAVAAGIRERGETPMMHAAATNTHAIRLYLSLGFELRARRAFLAVRVPAPAEVA